MTAREFFQAGQLSEAVRALNVEVRDNPADVKRRTFLFELLCFAGEFERAEKQLSVLAQSNKQSEMGALVYYSALHAERLRQEKFKNKDLSAPGAQSSFAGTLNGVPFQTIADADPRLGARFEVFAAGAYLWIPFEHIVAIRMQPPQKLRDLLWSPAIVQTGEAFRERELGEVLAPVLCPLSYTHPDESVRLGRSTVWDSVDGVEVPFGQRMLLVDGEEVPLLDVRDIEFVQQETATA